jgi:hypothetical protein
MFNAAMQGYWKDLNIFEFSALATWVQEVPSVSHAYLSYSQNLP